MSSRDRFFCAAAAQARGEPVSGTASRVDRWLLLEAPGPWGSRALPETRDIDDGTLRALQLRAKTAHARTLLIRQRAHASLGRGTRRVFVADSRAGHELLLTRLVDDADLADLILPFEGDAAGWKPADALVGVCTHGSHDTCCAVRGQPVAAALTRSHPDITWETSHLGGDRFAANALVLPGGHYLGQLLADSAPAVVDTLLAGERPDPFYRGRSCWSTPVQAALTFASTELRMPALDQLHPSHVDAVGDKRWLITVQVGTVRSIEVEIAQTQGPESSPLTCHAQQSAPVPHWELKSLH